MAGKKNMDAAASFFTEASTPQRTETAPAPAHQTKSRRPSRKISEIEGRRTQNINALVFTDDYEGLKKIAAMKHTNFNALLREIMTEYRTAHKDAIEAFERMEDLF